MEIAFTAWCNSFLHSSPWDSGWPLWPHRTLPSHHLVPWQSTPSENVNNMMCLYPEFSSSSYISSCRNPLCHFHASLSLQNLNEIYSTCLIFYQSQCVLPSLPLLAFGLLNLASDQPRGWEIFPTYSPWLGVSIRAPTCAPHSPENPH